MSRDKGILLIGGTGFIGTALARRLAAERRPVHILARHDVTPGIPNTFMHCGSMADAAVLEKLLRECGTVVHLASTTTPGASISQPALEATENLLPTLRLLEVLQRYPEVQLMFFSSGGTLYGNPVSVPVGEDRPLAPRSYFAAGKMAIEGFLQAFGEQGAGSVTILRPSNAYGPGQAYRPGFGIIRTMLEHLRLGTPMEIWGDGETVRDFIYIDDLVEACCLVIGSSGASGVFNLGSGTGFSLNQVRAIIERVCGEQLHITYRPHRSIDVQRIVLDSSRIGRKLGWEPRTGLHEGIRLTWEWLRTR